MATRQDVETAIQAIENGGNNTAKEVRDVLTKLLDYTENNEVESDLIPFENNNFKKPVKSGGNAVMFYSFRGFEKFSVNFTMALKVLKKNEGNLSFKLEPGLLPKLKEIIAHNKISFIVPYTVRQGMNNLNNNIVNIGPVPMVFALEEPNILKLDFPGVGLSKSDMIYTSIQLHVPAHIE
ncbi:hypothetical protein [uncultured Psychroserpens sp.]|uniref:hypothetical protein n=1 Tax=uncultured Psychroserpens sp. TaxID=255436 RepID=UPI002620D40C|nr:hypothetical protein [uncultured Psychroserpens sp.]